MAALSTSVLPVTVAALPSLGLASVAGGRLHVKDVSTPLFGGMCCSTSKSRRASRRVQLVRCAETATLEAAEATVSPAITLTEKALKHLTKMRNENDKDLLLRIGVRQGGCSGMSYVMDFEERGNIGEGDSIIEHEGFAMVCDPKSLLFLYGMQLDFSDALIGGGFSFSNPNASATCGCGKSFAA